jgi:hypothetical protein
LGVEEDMTHDNIHTCSYECERPACIKAQRDELAQRLFELVAEAVAAEREACAKVCDHIKNDIYNNHEDAQPMARAVTNFCATAIRARGET